MTPGHSSTLVDRWPRPIAIRLPGVDRFTFVAAELEPLLGQLAFDLQHAARRIERSLHAMRSKRPPAASPADPPDPLGILPIEELVTQVCALGRNPGHPCWDSPPAAADCIRVARWASSLGARFTAIAFAQLAYEADQRSEYPDLTYAFELATLALQVPSLALSGAEWLTWVALKARPIGRWDLYSRALGALADRAAATLNLMKAELLRRLAAVGALAAHTAPPTRSAPPDPE